MDDVPDIIEISSSAGLEASRVGGGQEDRGEPPEVSAEHGSDGV